MRKLGKAKTPQTWLSLQEEGALKEMIRGDNLRN